MLGIPGLMKRKLTFSVLLATLGLGWVSARPIPQVVPPGAIQPAAPGQRNAPVVPDLKWSGRSSQIRRVEHASNGHIEVAHALILVGRNQTGQSDLLALAREAVDGAFGARPKLHEVDVSIYLADTYLGFGGPPPLLTAGVRHADQVRFRSDVRYPRLWLASQADTPAPAPHHAHAAQESHPVFRGSASELEQHRQLQRGDHHEALHNGLFFHGGPEAKIAALTFDDCPHPLYEPLLLDTLQRNGVKGTFFCIGRNARAYPYFIRDMAEQGHELANHTYHHVRLPGLPASQVRSELETTNQVLESISGKPVRMFRPPGGDYSPETLQIAREVGLTTAFWTDDPGDFDHPGEMVIENRLVGHLRPGGIVLLHDNVLETIDILPAFLRVARRESFRIVTASQLADD